VSPKTDEASSTPPNPPRPPISEDNIKRVPAEDLPSHKEGQRWDLSKRFSELMDDILPKIATVTHKVNAYTGTDYSGIEALRKEIQEQGTVSYAHNSSEPG
jgi:sensitive to high expression protein 9, mitochondrial